MQTKLAIDFGTTHSLVGAVSDGRVYPSLNIDPLAADPTVMRTLLYFPDEKNCFYGAHALAKFVENDLEGRLFRSFKSHLPSQTYLGSMVNNRPIPLDQMVGFFLLELKKRSESILQKECQSVLLGRPARYSMDEVSHNLALHRMKKAAEFAGFKEVSFLEEPVAASYSLRKTLTKPTTVLMVDLGGGTSDFSVVKLHPDGKKKEEVLAVAGVSVAGDALDAGIMKRRLANYFGSEVRYRVPMSDNILQMPPGIHMKLCYPAHIAHLKERDTYEFLKNTQKWALKISDKEKLERLFVLMDDQQIYSFFEEIEKVKRALSENEIAEFGFDYPDIEISLSMTRSEFNLWTKDVLDKIMAAMDQCLTDANLTREQIDMVCMTGGTAKVPSVRAELVKRFGEEKLSTAALFHSVLYGLVSALQSESN